MNPPPRLYKKWPSRNKFECNGYLIHGPDRIYFWIATFVLWFCGLSFLIFISPPLYAPSSALLGEGWRTAFIPVFSIIWVYAVVCQLIVSYSDPGIIPRQLPPLDENGNLMNPPLNKTVVIMGQTFLVRWCATCNIYRPPRAVHCGICDNCVTRFDHHCPYLGNCIGIRNYRHFTLFVICTFLSSILVLVHTAYFLVHRVLEEGVQGSFNAAPATMFFAWTNICITFFSTFFLGILVGYTCFLITWARTTNENIKQVFFNTENPYHMGIICN